MVNKEWICMAHGPFEGARAVCPRGCTTVERAFLTPTSISTGGRTKNIDKTLQMLASDYKLTDMNNQNATAAVKRPDSRAVNRMEEYNKMIQERFGGPWGVMPNGGTYQVGKGVVGSANGNGALGALSGIGAQPGDSLSEVRPTFQPISEKMIVHARDDSKIPT